MDSQSCFPSTYASRREVLPQECGIFYTDPLNYLNASNQLYLFTWPSPLTYRLMGYVLAVTLIYREGNVRCASKRQT